VDSKAVIRVALRLVEITLDEGALRASGRSTSTDVRCPLNSTGTAIYLPLKVSAFVQSPLAQDDAALPAAARSASGLRTLSRLFIGWVRFVGQFAKTVVIERLSNHR
jgi:hypothetical protein